MPSPLDAFAPAYRCPYARWQHQQSIDVDRYVAAAGYDGTPGSGRMPPPAAGPYLTDGSAPRPPVANERGWKDTVVVLPGEFDFFLGEAKLTLDSEKSGTRLAILSEL